MSSSASIAMLIAIAKKYMTNGGKGEKGEKGDTGSIGMNARDIELRKGKTDIEWRASTDVKVLVDYKSVDSQTIVQKEDTITKIFFVNTPAKAKYAQIKTVTLFGIDAEGNDVGNMNPSINTMPEGTTFPCLGGFDPSKKEYDISKIKEIEGNMSVQTAIDGMLTQFSSNPNMVDINKIKLWVSFLDENKEELAMVFVNFLIKQDLNESINTNWTTLVPLEDITGAKGEKGVNGREIELIKADNAIKWRYAGQEEGIGWTKLVELSELKGEQGQAGTIITGGTKGQFLISNGDGTTSWTTVKNGNEVAY